VTTRAGTFSALGWRWLLLGDGDVAHLVPQTVLSQSRTACHRSLSGVALREPVDGLFDEAPRCARCTHANGGVS
jgi:hypothetical protein